MTRNAKPNLDSFDPDVLEAARDVARRAGVPLEDWIAANVPQAGRRRHRSGAQPGREGGGRPAEDHRRHQPAPAEPPRQHRGPPAQAAGRHEPERNVHPDTSDRGMDALMARLSDIDRMLAEDRQAVSAAASERLEAIESRIARALDAGAAPVEQVTARLGDIERRMSELGDKVASARPYARRGRPATDEIRDAVQEIRLRQREIGGAPDAHPPTGASIVAGMRQDLARRLDVGMHEDLVADTAMAVSELRRETNRLRESIVGLATTRDVGALEQAMISLATNVEQAQPSADLAAITAPIEIIRGRVEQLAEQVAEDVHTRVKRDLQSIAERLDRVAAGSPDGARREGAALAGLFQELEEIRRLIGSLAGPERIQGLAQGMQAISGQIAELRAAAEDASGAGLRPLLEEIRSGLSTPAPAFIGELRAMSDKLDALQVRTGNAEQAQARAILGRIDALSDKVDQAREPMGHPDPGQPQVAGSGDGMASIHAMLRNLADKVDRVGERAGGDGLDALERQVVTLANRLDSRGTDPALAGLERTMGDLLKQVSALRDQAPDAAALEQAARSAVAASLVEARPADDRSEIGLLRASLADLQARQASSDQRLATMLEGVQGALDRLSSRLDPAAEASPVSGLRQPSLNEQLMASTAAEAPRARAARRPEAPRAEAAAHPAAPGRSGDELLEPGAGRPMREAHRELADLDALLRERPAQAKAPAADAQEGGETGDIKTSFIAAARRAAQAAQAELATESAGERREARQGGRAAKSGRPDTASGTVLPAADGPLARLRAQIQRRRRPLLLGLAAIVLALGALQAISMRSAEEAPTVPQIAATGAVRPDPAVSAPSGSPAAEAGPKAVGESASKPALPRPGSEAASRPPVADPLTTQSIASDPAPARPRGAIPKVPAMAAMAGEIANMPASLAKVRQSALDGDGSAVWELAARSAEGRGVNRDFALAAKLYEKIAAAGYAQAQYKLGGLYEKGTGVTRDLVQAKLWYGRAAEQGHARSMHNLAVIYAENATPSGKPDYASAASWFKQAAEYGVRDSQYNLGVLYARGMGVTQDLVQSYLWFSAAAAQGDDDAGRKRDDVANKLAPADLASAKGLAAAFKPRRIDPAINEAPPVPESTPMTLLGAPTPSPNAFAPRSGKGV